MKTKLIAFLLMLTLFLSGCGGGKTGVNDKTAGNYYTNGMYKVGDKITAGEYVAIGAYDSDEVFVRSSDNRNANNFVFRDMTIGRRHVILHDGEYLDVTVNVKVYPLADAPKVDTNKKIPQGQYKGGTDIPAGEYKITPKTDKSALYFVTTTPNYLGKDIPKEEVVDFGSVTDSVNVSVASGDYLTMLNCEAELLRTATVTPIKGADPAPTVVKDPFEPDSSQKKITYKIGADIPQGRYKLVMAENSFFRIENPNGEIVLDGKNYARPLVLFDGQRLTVWNGAIEVVEDHQQSTPKPAPAAETPAPRLTVDEFEVALLDNLNAAAGAMGIGGADAMGEPERRTESGRDVFIYHFGDGVTLSEFVANGGVKKVTVIVANLTRENLFAALVLFDSAAHAFSPGADVNAIHRDLGLGADIIDKLDKAQSTKLGGINYSKKIVDKKLIFAMSD